MSLAINHGSLFLKITRILLVLNLNNEKSSIFGGFIVVSMVVGIVLGFAAGFAAGLTAGVSAGFGSMLFLTLEKALEITPF